MAHTTRPSVLFTLALLACPAAAWQSGADGEARRAPATRAIPLEELGSGRVQFLRTRLERPDGGCFDEARWRERLLQPDLALRELAFEELVRELPRCAEGQRVVQGWTLSAAPELAWSARLALREVRRQPDASWTHVVELEQLLPDGALSVLEEPDFGLQLRQFPGLPDGMFAYGGGLGLHSPRAFSLPFAQCEERDGRVYCVRMGEEGVAVEILDSARGEESRREFTGRSLEQILEAHPELAREVPELRSMIARRDVEGEATLRWSPGRIRMLLDQAGQDGVGRALVIRGELVLGSGALGVDCGPLSPERARELGLEPQHGLMVERTWPGSIATRIELKRGDVLLELNGRSLSTGADLRAAIREAGPAGRIVVRLVDREGQTRSLSWEPAGDEE